MKDKPVSFSRIYEGVAELESLLDDLDYPIVILLSDGNETEHPNSFNSLVNRSLYWGALPVRKSRIVRMKSFDGPSKVLKNRNFKLRCLIHSSETSDITLELLEMVFIGDSESFSRQRLFFCGIPSEIRSTRFWSTPD